jgi:hypothetical protein
MKLANLEPATETEQLQAVITSERQTEVAAQNEEPV